MIDGGVVRKCWELLDRRERINAWITLGVMTVGALSSALMVGSIMPFLAVLSTPSKVETVAPLARAYALGGFETPHDFLVALGLAAFAAIILASAIQVAKAYVVARFTMMRIHSIGYRLISTYLQQPYEFFLNRHTGEMIGRVVVESQQVVTSFLRPMAELVAAALTIIAIVGLLLWVDPMIALIALAVLSICYGGVYTFVRTRLRYLGLRRVKANDERFRFASEALGGVKEIKLLGREDAYALRFATPSRVVARAYTLTAVISTIPQFVLQGITFGGIILLCFALMNPEDFATGKALGEIVPVLGVFAFAGQRLMPELQKVYRSLAVLQATAPAVEALHRDLVEHAPSALAPSLPSASMGLSESLCLSHVSYSYPNAERTGLSDVSVGIRAGEKVGIVGGSGAGKTTFADIVLGLLPPAQGAVLVDGTPITADNVRAWQKNVGYVPQEISLADASVAENIALGLAPDEIDQTQLERAARIAQLDEFVRSELTKGYETHVGERGLRLSGGQRQRIGVARALYHNADLIVFDEATSALDNVTERQVMESIYNMPGDKTVLMVAHRLSSVRFCDRILVLDGGQVADFGTWDELVGRCKLFCDLVELAQAA